MQYSLNNAFINNIPFDKSLAGYFEVIFNLFKIIIIFFNCLCNLYVRCRNTPRSSCLTSIRESVMMTPEELLTENSWAVISWGQMDTSWWIETKSSLAPRFTWDLIIAQSNPKDTRVQTKAHRQPLSAVKSHWGTHRRWERGEVQINYEALLGHCKSTLKLGLNDLGK